MSPAVVGLLVAIVGGAGFVAGAIYEGAREGGSRDAWSRLAGHEVER